MYLVEVSVEDAINKWIDDDRAHSKQVAGEEDHDNCLSPGALSNILHQLGAFVDYV